MTSMKRFRLDEPYLELLMQTALLVNIVKSVKVLLYIHKCNFTQIIADFFVVLGGLCYITVFVVIKFIQALFVNGFDFFV